MDGYSPSRIQRNKKGKKHHETVVDEGDPIKCSGKKCRSCSGGVIADCVAVCCCPCAVVNILALAFLKIPWMVGRKCLQMVKNNKERRKHDKSHYFYSTTDRVDSVEGIVMTCSFSKEELKDSFDVEDVWLDLCQVDHMGFGRVSFTGTN